MTIAHAYTVAFQGIDPREVDVQVHIDPGMPAFTVVGLGDKAVTESRERVRSALSAIGLALPPKRIVINLAPADLPKEGSHYDLPIALGLLAALNVLPSGEMEGFVAVGELSLDGLISPVTGVLPAAMAASGMGRGLICPKACGAEGAWVGDVNVLAPASLIQLINHFKGTQILSPPRAELAEETASVPDMRDIKGQEMPKRALEIAASGGHNLLMTGPPGAGKSMLASRLPGLLPPLDAREALDVSMIASLAGQLKEGRISRRRPYRAPHHSASMAALVGGGLRAKPGEVSLAHNGVLFLDELPEFQKGVLDSLRQPLETGWTLVARANAHVRYPSRVQLIAAMNPCRCGYLGDPSQACSRAPRCAQDYQARISGPLLDRIDLHVDVPPVRPQDLSGMTVGECTEDIAGRVSRARKRQRDRYEALGVGDEVRVNAHADGELLEAVARPDGEGRVLLTSIADKMKLSARGYHRVLRVARTLADMEGVDGVRRPHIAEAAAFRRISVER